MSRNWYQVLGVCPEAELSLIKATYQRLLLQYHPDKRDPGDTVAEDTCRSLIEAWRVLGQPDSRQRYDAELRSVLTAEEELVWKTVFLDDVTNYKIHGATWDCRCGDQFAIAADQVAEARDQVADELRLECETCSLILAVTLAPEPRAPS